MYNNKNIIKNKKKKIFKLLKLFNKSFSKTKLFKI